MTGQHPDLFLFQRRAHLNTPDYRVDHTEPADIAHQRIQTQADLWAAIETYEQANRRLDGQLSYREAAAAQRRRAAHQDEIAARADARADLWAEQNRADRIQRAAVWAEQRGLRHEVDTFTDGHGDRHERHLLTAPAGHPDLAVPAWQSPSLAAVVDGQQVVPTVDGVTLEAVETWLGLPHDPAKSGAPQPTPHPATIGADQ